MGESVLRDYVEDTGIEFDAVDTGQIMLEITEYRGAGSYVSDKLKQDGYKAAALEAQIPMEHMRLIKEAYEADLLAQANKQTLSDPNLINGFAHRWVANSGATTGVITLKDFLYAKLSADKARMPSMGRVAIVDPVTEAALNVQVGAQAFSDNPQFEGIVNTGFAQNNKFFRNIFGWDIYVSQRLPEVASETVVGGPHGASAAITDGIVNVFMCAADDMTTPFMGAWRQMPTTEGFRNVTGKRDEYSTTARWGFGVQRFESLISIISSQSLFE